MAITPEQLKKFREHMVAAAKNVGVELHLGKITYNEEYFQFSSKAYIIGSDGKYEEFKKYANKKDVPLHYYGKKFINNNGEEFTVTAIKPRGRKNVLEITRKDNKKFVCNVGYVRQFDTTAKTGSMICTN